MEISNGHRIDLPRLLETRLLVQANSGGGKSWCLRRLLEQTASHVQQIVIDPEGEFSTLRERFDYVICAPEGGDAVAHPSTAAILARRLLETGVSAILNIYDLKAPQRLAFVRAFFESLVNAPKSLWHPVLIVLDEAHIFCPESGRAESAAAVIDLATRGRKRGYCLTLATQRLSKLHKDAAAEMLNKLIGRTGLDIDMKRAADELGLSGREAVGALRRLSAGEFFTFGPAFSEEVKRITVGPVMTTHPKAGGRLLASPPEPSAKIRAILAKGLQDIPRDADRAEATQESLQAENVKLKQQVVDLQRRVAAVSEPRRGKFAPHTTAGLPAGAEVRIRSLLEKALAELQLPDQAQGSRIQVEPVASVRPLSLKTIKPIQALKAGTGGLSAPEQRILDTLANLLAFGLPAAQKAMVAAHAGVSPTSGGFFNNLGRLRSAGLVEYPSAGMVRLTASGRAKANVQEAAPTLSDLHDSWLRILPRPQAEILGVLIRAYPAGLAKPDLADQVGVSRSSGGYFNNLGRLRTLGAIEYPQAGTARAADLLFPRASD